MFKINNCAAISAALEAALNKIDETKKSKAWDDKKNKDVETFKGLVKSHGMKEQDYRCAWCTLLIGSAGRRSGQRDHIAPKGSYPQSTFTALNIVMTCEYCNGTEVKGRKDTVSDGSGTYANWKFHLVHPYLDEPKTHLRFFKNFFGTGVTIVGLDDKGLWTIKELKLATPEMTSLRAQDVELAKMVSRLPQRLAELFSKATGRI